MKRALFALGLVLAIGVGAFAISHNRDTKVPVNPAPSITPPATEANPTMVSAADEIAQTLSALNNYGAISGRYESLDESGVFVLSNNGSYRIEHGKLLETFLPTPKQSDGSTARTLRQ